MNTKKWNLVRWSISAYMVMTGGIETGITVRPAKLV